MTEKPTYEQLEKQLQLAEMSNSALRYSLKKEKTLSMKRLRRAQVIQSRLDKAKKMIEQLEVAFGHKLQDPPSD